jgi:K+ transporter
MPPKKKNIKPNDTVNDEEAEITPVANVNYKKTTMTYNVVFATLKTVAVSQILQSKIFDSTHVAIHLKYMASQ